MGINYRSSGISYPLSIERSFTVKDASLEGLTQKINAFSKVKPDESGEYQKRIVEELGEERSTRWISMAVISYQIMPNPLQGEYEAIVLVSLRIRV